ncbi:MAG: Co2+/Mg2+ efflux protein ApaG [Candidatus Pacebacteria bacterium]|nr:Co2+/Mg2+ efflux protein ApaG [Candidatus Paceibacterota bacterium]
MYQKTTGDISITVKPYFLRKQSQPEDDQFFWAYHVEIANSGSESVKLLRRHWSITDAKGYVHEVDGEGVVGEQPVIEPGSSYEYTSAAPLSTPSGMMVGTYQMTTSQGENFLVAIPAFSLDSPFERSQPN